MTGVILQGTVFYNVGAKQFSHFICKDLSRALKSNAVDTQGIISSLFFHLFQC